MTHAAHSASSLQTAGSHQFFTHAQPELAKECTASRRMQLTMGRHLWTALRTVNSLIASISEISFSTSCKACQVSEDACQEQCCCWLADKLCTAL